MGNSEAAKPATAAIGEPASNVEGVAALDIQAHTSKLSLVQVRCVRRFRAIDNTTIGHCETSASAFQFVGIQRPSVQSLYGRVVFCRDGTERFAARSGAF
jgi:hypothetical protein